LLTFISILQERFEAVEEILQSPSAGIIKLRTLLKGLPDIVKGLCRIQYGKSNPKEVANVLVALSRVANAFDPIEKPEDAGFKSSLLNDIIFAMPRIREAVEGLLGDLNLKNAKEGEITDLWASPEKYPELEDVRFVSEL
jgi:DNA mismatch repair protein MSH3